MIQCIYPKIRPDVKENRDVERTDKINRVYRNGNTIAKRHLISSSKFLNLFIIIYDE